MKKNNFLSLIFISAFICFIENEARSYYEILGIKKDATTAEIKKAFRNQALKFHPDKIKPSDRDENTEAKFREIVSAYEVLVDEDKRRAYDQHGQTQFNEGGQSGGQDFNREEFFKNFDEAFKKHQEAHRSAHERAHEQAKKQHEEHMKRHHGFRFDFDDLFDDDLFSAGIHGNMGDDLDVMGEGSSFFQESITNSNSNGQTCKTIRRQQGNTVTTHTECHGNGN